MRIRTPHRVAAAVAGVALAVTLAVPAVAATRSAPNTLQSQVDVVLNTGDVGVIAESTDQRGHRYAAGGEADTSTAAAARPYDSFRIGSATKTFVATVILQLVGEHRLSLEDTVDHWLPGVVTGNGNDGTKITVRELLQHTSGIYDYTQDFPELASAANFERLRLTTFTATELVAIAMRHQPDFAPGTNWAYSNTNYVLAGMIIQEVTGHSWQDEVDRRIIGPLHLRHTAAPTTDPAIHGPHLHGYAGPAPAIDTTLWNPSAADAAGAIISTTQDLTTFYSALMRGRLIAPAQLAQMETTVPAPGLSGFAPGTRYGLGLIWIPLTCGGGYYSHGGDVPGYSTRDGFSADGARVVVAVRTGAGDGSEQAMANLVDQQLCEH
jgi:D-alanyl-D-alanine carboxypeptidase